MTELMQRRRALMMVTKDTLPIQEIGVNLLEEKAKGYKVDVNTGELIQSSSVIYSVAYIPINPNYQYKMVKYGNRPANLVWYDKNYGYISGRSYSNTTPWAVTTPPSNARYARMSCNDGNGSFEFFRYA